VTRKEDSLLYWYDVSRGRGHEWENAMDAAAPSPQAQAQQGLTECWCTTCRPITLGDMRFVACPTCGDKRCVHAKNHAAPCAMNDIYEHNLWVERELRASTAAAPSPVPAGFKLLQDTTHAQRSWPEDASHENGNYSCCCCHCLRMFTAHKRRVVCKVCAAAPGAPTPAPKGAE
jgi:hypothetical protein